MVHQGISPQGTPPWHITWHITPPNQGDSREIIFLSISMIHTCEMATASLQIQVYFFTFRYSALIQTLFEPFKGLISEIMKKMLQGAETYPLLFYFHSLNTLTVLVFDLHFGVCSF